MRRYRTLFVSAADADDVKTLYVGLVYPIFRTPDAGVQNLTFIRGARDGLPGTVSQRRFCGRNTW